MQTSMKFPVHSASGIVAHVQNVSKYIRTYQKLSERVNRMSVFVLKFEGNKIVNFAHMGQLFVYI